MSVSYEDPEDIEDVRDHDPLTDDLMRILSVYGLSSVLYGLKGIAEYEAQKAGDRKVRRVWECIGQEMDSAYVDAQRVEE